MDKENNTITIISTIATIGILAVMTVTLICQKGFNKKQIEFNKSVLDLSEVSIVPLVFAEFDSLIPLKSEDDRNVFYTLRNVGSTPAFNLRPACYITELNVNPFEVERDTSGVMGDLFPTQEKSIGSKRDEFKCRGGVYTLYFHVRVDYQDMLERRYCYKATHWIFARGDSATNVTKLESGMEKSEFIPLGKR